MALEIERKFLVKFVPDEVPINISPYVFQGYLKVGKDYEVRISNRFHLKPLFRLIGLVKMLASIRI